jgi:SAM-dependent methyltransferase
VRTVLVPGAGYGRNTAFFVANGFRVDAIELSGQALLLARDHDPATRFFKGSVLDMPFSADVYDAVYCFNVLHLFREADRARFVGKCREQLARPGLA